MKTVIIEVRGGVVQEVYSEESHLNVVVIDWDNFDSLRVESVRAQFRPHSMRCIPATTQIAISDMT